MYPYRVSIGRPSWTGATYRAILHSLCSGRVVDGPDLEQLRSSVLQQLGVEEAILCGSGSFALELALRACGVGRDDEVVIPTFCCTSVVPPILALGAAPVFADVGEELNLTAETVAAALTEKTKAVIAPHLFGNPADIPAIIELVRQRNIRVIDDAAQALGATIDSRPVGGFGHAGILSFGEEKVCSGLGGGVAVFGAKRALDDSTVGLSPAELSPALRRLLSSLIRRRWRRWTLPLERLLARRHGPDSPPAPYRRETMANLKAAVAVSLVETLGENLAARRARVRLYQELLGDSERLALIPHRPGSACLAQVARLFPRSRGDDPAARVIEVLGLAGYEIQGSYVPIHLLAAYGRFCRAPLPHAEKAWSDLIELPCEPDVSLDDVERIAAVVRRALRR